MRQCSCHLRDQVHDIRQKKCRTKGLITTYRHMYKILYNIKLQVLLTEATYYFKFNILLHNIIDIRNFECGIVYFFVKMKG